MTARRAAYLVTATALALAAGRCKPAPAPPRLADAGPIRPVPWLEAAQPFVDQALAAPPPPRSPFGRVRLSVTSTETSLHCPMAPCSHEAHLYVRAEHVVSGVRLRPQCSALGEDPAALELLADAGALELEDDAFAAGKSLSVRARPGFEVHVAVESWSRPAPLPVDALAAWGYVRGLVVAHARSFGVELPLVPSPNEAAPPRIVPYASDAWEASQGSPMALLSAPDAAEPLNGKPRTVPVVPERRRRWRLEAPVSSGSWSRFCGRPNDFEQEGMSCGQVTERMLPFMDALAEAGVDLPRFVLGAVLTNGTTYYPQVNLRHLATALECAGWGDLVLHTLEDASSMPGLDWQNRLRAACLARLLGGKACDTGLLEGFAETQPPDAEDGVDQRCLRALLGEVDWACLGG